MRMCPLLSQRCYMSQPMQDIKHPQPPQGLDGKIHMVELFPPQAL